jgi:cobalt/nickel transport system permease protein
MSHLHIPDGVLPLWLWGPGWALALVALVAMWRTQRDRAPQRVAYEGAIGALMLAAMALEVPLGPVEYHLTLAGPIGVLLGPAGAFQAAFIASALLAFIGHGGLTLIGLNALLLGTAAVLASLVYPLLARRWSGPASLAGATLAGHTASGIAWLLLVLAAARFRVHDLGLEEGARLGILAGLAIPLVAFAAAAETVVAFGMGKFLARVRPDLMPRADLAARTGIEG